MADPVNSLPPITAAPSAEPIGPMELHNLAIPLLGRTLTIERMTIPAGLAQWLAPLVLAELSP